MSEMLHPAEQDLIRRQARARMAEEKYNNAFVRHGGTGEKLQTPKPEVIKRDRDFDEVCPPLPSDFDIRDFNVGNVDPEEPLKFDAGDVTLTMDPVKPEFDSYGTAVYSVPSKRFSDRWEQIFGKKKGA